MIRCAVAFASLLLASPLVAQAPGRAVAARDLRDVFARGWLIDDRNADDLTDFVGARVLLPPAPSAAEVAAGANVAARLGWETTALNLGLAATDDGRPFEAPVVRVARGFTGLSPGEGSLVALPVDDRQRQGGVELAGGDATGLLAAAGYLSSRYPSIWNVDGASWSDIVARVRMALDSMDASPDSVALERIVVDGTRRGVSRAVVRVELRDTAALSRVAAELRRPRSDSAARGDTTAGRRRAVSLTFPDLRRLDIRLSAGTRSDTVHVRNDRARETALEASWQPRDASDFSLSDLYTIRGLYRDTNQDLVPDRTEAYITLAGSDAGFAVIDLAARIELETAGSRLPLVHLDAQDDAPERLGIPLVLGVDHFQARRLRKAGRLAAGGDVTGEGIVEFVKGGFGGKHGIVVSGADPVGLEAATTWLARRAPYLWDHGKGNYRLSDVETEVRRFFQAREAPGQTALALHKLRTWLDRLHGRDIDSIAVEIATKERPNGLDRHVYMLLRRAFPGAATKATTYATGFGVGDTVFTQAFELPWEVDTVRHALRDALPRLRTGARGRIEVRVSEPPEVRAGLTAEIRRDIAGRGLAPDSFDVHVLAAYKQGYSWLHDDVLLRLRGRAVRQIEIGYHSLKESKEVRWQAMESDTRWLQELYPIDAVLARELGIPDSAIVFVPRQQAAPIYTVRALDGRGQEVLRDRFDPKYVVRPFFDLFPEYEQVRVTTGWLAVTQGSDTIVSRRVRTDPEAFWDRLQTETFGRIIEYVMDIQDGRPSPANAPFFDELRVDLTLSEPDHRIGVDEEVISSLEALHEDIYFETLTLFDLIGGRYGVGGLDYAGRVLPWIHRAPRPGPGHARISLTGKNRGVPELILTWRERGGEPVRMRYALSPLPVEAPKLRGATLRGGASGVQRLLFDVVTVDSIDRWDDVKDRASEGQIDRQLLPVPLFQGMVSSLRMLQDDGILASALSFDRVAELRFRFVLKDDSAGVWSRAVDLPRTASPASTRNPRLLARDWRSDGSRLVQWDTPIPPPENDTILARIATFPTANVYFMLKSFLGQNTFAVDFLPPHEAAYVSQAKRNALKPTLFLSGRQHANEVSSTSHILRLAELLATDSSYTELLKSVNVVLHPITNPDGARLAYEMQRENPDFMLHAGYLGALGVDVTAGSSGDDPIYPESRARPELQETWLPDIAMNLHGYPSHEWVQYFAGYSAWVRSRTGTQRSWWAPRGWFVPGFSWVDDPANPEYRAAQFAILDSIAAAITGHAEVEAMNRRMYERYAKYGRQDVENFREHFHNGMLIYLALRGRESIGTGVGSPRITYFAATTEAPDETARGDWLRLVADAGLAHTTALLRYLAQGQNRVERETNAFDGAVVRKVWRKKPVLPKAETPADGPGR